MRDPRAGRSARDEARAGSARSTSCSDSSATILELALREALSLGHNYVGMEHLLLGLVREDAGIAAVYLESKGAPAETIRDEVIRQLRGAKAKGEPVHSDYQRGWNDGYRAGARERKASDEAA